MSDLNNKRAPSSFSANSVAKKQPSDNKIFRKVLENSVENGPSDDVDNDDVSFTSSDDDIGKPLPTMPEPDIRNRMRAQGRNLYSSCTQ